MIAAFLLQFSSADLALEWAFSWVFVPCPEKGLAWESVLAEVQEQMQVVAEGFALGTNARLSNLLRHVRRMRETTIVCIFYKSYFSNIFLNKLEPGCLILFLPENEDRYFRVTFTSSKSTC